MIFSHISKDGLAAFYVTVHQERIRQDLQIKILNIVMVMKVVARFIASHHDYIVTNFETQYDTLWNEQFYSNVINALKKAKKRGVPLEITLMNRVMPN